MKKKLSENDARMYLAEILVAIEELHKNGIIHRDIKLDNILLDKDGHAKLTDFGLSKEGMFEKKLTNTMLGGGRSYQIPEVIKEDPYEKSVDLYLFGLMAYEIMNGKAAFPAETPSPDLENNILESKYREPTELSSEARDLISKLIISNPEKRLTIAKVKRHPFFNTKASTIDWKGVSEGLLKMPHINPRPIVKSDLPFKYGEDSDDGDDDYYKRDNQSSEGEAYAAAVDDDEDGMPQMQEVHVNGSPLIPK
jgi:serine/threonine protein kinase